MWAIFTFAVYHPYMYMFPSEGVIIIQPIILGWGVIFEKMSTQIPKMSYMRVPAI